MAHSSRTAAAARRRKATASRNVKINRLAELLRKAFPDYWTHIGDQIVIGVKDENHVVIGLRSPWFPSSARDDAECMIKDRKGPLHAALKEVYATLPDSAHAKVTVQIGGQMPVHPCRRKLLLLLNAIESAFPWLKKSPEYGSSAIAGGSELGKSIDNSLLIYISGADISPDDLERVCRSPGKVRVRLKDVCDTTGIEGHEDEPLSPIHFKVNNVQKTVTYASIFKSERQQELPKMTTFCPCCETKVGETRVDDSKSGYVTTACAYCGTRMGEIRQTDSVAAQDKPALVECAVFVAPVYDHAHEEDWVPDGSDTKGDMYGVYAFTRKESRNNGGAFQLVSRYDIKEDAFDEAAKLNKEYWKLSGCTGT